MDFGIGFFSTDETPDPPTLARWCEERGFESVFFVDHTHIPASRETPWPVGGDLPREYWRHYEQMSACAAAAAATERIKVGTGICLVIERDPILTAKQTASIDHMSGGRFLFGVGAGWNLEEMRNHGTDPETRFGQLRERVEAIKTIWTEEEAEYHGKYVDFEPIWCDPKPAQKPHPPVLVGGNAKQAPDRVLAFGDEWFPNRIGDDEKIAARIEKLRSRGEEAGRGPIPSTLANAPTEPELIERYEQAGVHRMLYWVQGDGDRFEGAVDKLAGVVASYNGG